MPTLFTEAEENALNKRMKGDKADPTGIYAARVKPKIKELLNRWFPIRKKLKGLLK